MRHNYDIKNFKTSSFMLQCYILPTKSQYILSSTLPALMLHYGFTYHLTCLVFQMKMKGKIKLFNT